MTIVELARDPVGTPHQTARCHWCQSSLVIAEVGTPVLRCWVCPRDYMRQMACALVLQTAAGRSYRHVPLPSQVPIYEWGATGGSLLWGGRAGAAKSVGVRWWLYHRSLSVPGHEALLLRENLDQLKDNHTSKMAYEVPALGGKWFEGDSRAVFGKGSDESIISCGHMAEAASVLRYRGGNKGAIAADEASLYPVDHEGISVLAELRTMARREHVDRAGRTVRPVFVCATNPGGPSAAWLQQMFVHHEPDYELFPRLRPTFGAQGEQLEGYRPEQWHYQPATLDENPYMDPHYRRDNLSGLSEVRYQQLAEGNWEIFAGAFFPEWDPSVHVRRAVLMEAA